MYNGCTICRSIVGDKTWSHIAARFAVALVTKRARETKRAATSPFQIFHHHRYVASLYY